MARFRRLEVLGTLQTTGLLPIFYHGDLEVALRVAGAVAAGGCRFLEFTNRGDRAHLVFTALVERCEREHPELILGAGSIIDPATAAIYLAAGANYLVSPSFDPEVAKLANRRKVPYIPGCGSATEIQRAEEHGCEILKLFPADAIGGTKFVRAVLGPCPWTSLMPTGGVELSEESVREWIQAGSPCIGMGQKLISKDLLAKQDYPELTRRVKQLLAWIRAARG